MAGLRIILGALEAGLYPGSVYLLSTWYPRYELQKRNATFYLIGSMASGFGGILAYGLMQMDGLAGRAGWRWIFIVSLYLQILLYTYIPSIYETRHESILTLKQKIDRGPANLHPGHRFLYSTC
jgi:MFS family permease